MGRLRAVLLANLLVHRNATTFNVGMLKKNWLVQQQSCCEFPDIEIDTNKGFLDKNTLRLIVNNKAKFPNFHCLLNSFF